MSFKTENFGFLIRNDSYMTIYILLFPFLVPLYIKWL